MERIAGPNYSELAKQFLGLNKDQGIRDVLLRYTGDTRIGQTAFVGFFPNAFDSEHSSIGYGSFQHWSKMSNMKVDILSNKLYNYFYAKYHKHKRHFKKSQERP